MDTESTSKIQREFWAKIDALHEMQIDLGLFDPQVLAPLDWLVSQGGAPKAEVLRLVQEGVLPKRKSQDGEPGFTIFTEAQIRFMIELRATLRYSEEEVEHIIRYENRLIDCVFLEVSPYDDRNISDLENFRRRIAQEIEETLDQNDGPPSNDDDRPALTVNQQRQLELMAVQRARLEKIAGMFHDKSEGDLTERQTLFYQKHLFRLRWRDEWFLTLNVSEYEAQVRQGYSPEFMFSDHAFDGNGHYEFGPPRWSDTLIGYQDSRSRGRRFPLRTPDFIYSENGLTLKTGTSPTCYSEVFARYRIDELFSHAGGLGEELWNAPEIPKGAETCAACRKVFEPENPKRKYCTEACRQSAKRRRWRGRDPERARLANARYYARHYSDSLYDSDV